MFTHFFPDDNDRTVDVALLLDDGLVDELLVLVDGGLVDETLLPVDEVVLLADAALAVVVLEVLPLHSGRTLLT